MNGLMKAMVRTALGGLAVGCLGRSVPGWGWMITAGHVLSLVAAVCLAVLVTWGLSRALRDSKERLGLRQDRRLVSQQEAERFRRDLTTALAGAERRRQIIATLQESTVSMAEFSTYVSPPGWPGRNPRFGGNSGSTSVHFHDGSAPDIQAGGSMGGWTDEVVHIRDGMMTDSGGTVLWADDEAWLDEGDVLASNFASRRRGRSAHYHYDPVSRRLNGMVVARWCDDSNCDQKWNEL